MCGRESIQTRKPVCSHLPKLGIPEISLTKLRLFEEQDSPERHYCCAVTQPHDGATFALASSLDLLAHSAETVVNFAPPAPHVVLTKSGRCVWGLNDSFARESSSEGATRRASEIQ